MIGRPTIRWSTVILIVLAVIWSYPVVWTLSNALKTTADLYQGPLALPIPTCHRKPRRGLGSCQSRRRVAEFRLRRRR